LIHDGHVGPRRPPGSGPGSPPAPGKQPLDTLAKRREFHLDDVPDVLRGLADDLEASDDGMLRLRVREERVTAVLVNAAMSSIAPRMCSK